MPAHELSRLLANPWSDWSRLQKLLKAPPAEDVERIAAAVIGFLGAYSELARCKAMAPALIRRVIDEPLPPRLPPRAHAQEMARAQLNLIFLKHAVPPANDDAQLARSWRAAVTALLTINVFTGGSTKHRREKLATIARMPRLLEAMQTAVVACDPALVPFDCFALLAVDGSDASADALLPHFHHAATLDDKQLGLFARLAALAAPTRPMQAMLREVEQLLAARSAASPAAALLERLAIEADALDFALRLRSRAFGYAAKAVSANVDVDSRARPCLRVTIFRPHGSETRFDEREVHQDQLRLGSTTLEELPQYLARVAKQLRIRWQWRGAMLDSTQRRTARDKILAWLRGDASDDE